MPGVMDRPPGEPRRQQQPPAVECIPDEPCDRCGAPSRHRVSVPYPRPDGSFRHGTLLFCGHHYRQHEIALLLDGRLAY